MRSLGVALAATAMLAVLVGPAASAAGEQTSGTTEDLKTSRVVWDPFGDVDFGDDDDISANDRGIDIRWAEWTTFREGKHVMVRLRMKLRDAVAYRPERVLHQGVAEIHTGSPGAEPLMTVVFNNGGQIDTFHAFGDETGHSGIDPKRERTWVNPRKDILGAAISAERFDGRTSFYGEAFTSRGGMHPIDYAKRGGRVDLPQP